MNVTVERDDDGVACGGRGRISECEGGIGNGMVPWDV